MKNKSSFHLFLFKLVIVLLSLNGIFLVYQTLRNRMEALSWISISLILIMVFCYIFLIAVIASQKFTSVRHLSTHKFFWIPLMVSISANGLFFFSTGHVGLAAQNAVLLAGMGVFLLLAKFKAKRNS